MLSTGFVVNFAPETWSFGHRFNKFMGPPFHVDSALRAGVASGLAHQDKYCLLVDIANQFASTLDEDEAELEAHGYTPARRTRSFAALSETMVAEQYAMLDGFRKVVHSIFRTVQGTQDTSTQKLFKRASDAGYGPIPAGHVGAHLFPELNARLAAAHADWFPLLCQVRTLTTHGRTGNCYRDRTTRRISYRYSDPHGRPRGVASGVHRRHRCDARAGRLEWRSTGDRGDHTGPSIGRTRTDGAKTVAVYPSNVCKRAC